MERLSEGTEQEVERPETACQNCGEKVTGVVLAGVAIRIRLCPRCAVVEAAKDEEELRVKLTERALVRAGQTAHLRGLTLATHPDAVACAVAASWLASYRSGERHNLWLYGPVGTRKTGLAWGIVRDLALEAVDRFFELGEEYRGNEPHAPALLLVWRDLYDELVASFDANRRALARGDDADPSALLLLARRVPVLCLDDLGAGRPPTPYALEQLEILVDRRYQADLPTIITSNLNSARDLAARLGHEDRVAGERIATRLVEGAVRHRFDGENVRHPAAA